MRLLSLKLRNFKGVNEFELAPGGANLNVFGDNGTGKTTVADAFIWLLFDKDSANRKDFEIKTLDATGKPIHGLEHEVEAVLDLEPGQITLRKVYSEQWTKKRGAATKQFTGHTTEYFMDGVPATKGEFAARVSGIADEAAFRLVTDPTYFNDHLHWQKRREILLQVCGDVSDAEVIASNKELAGLPEILGSRTLDDHRKVLAAKRAEINKELDRIPVRIDEARRSIPEAGGDATVLKAQLATLRGQRQQVEEERARIQSGGEAAELNKRLREIETEILDLQRKHRLQADTASQEARGRVSSLTREADGKAIEARRLRAQIAEDERQLEKLHGRMDDARQRWHQANARELTLSVDEVCPACHQHLPADQVREARERATADHNAHKSRELQEISADGKRLAEQATALENGIEAALKLAEKAEQQVDVLQRQAAEAQAEVERLQSAETPALGNDPEKARLEAERQRIAAERDALAAGNQTALLNVLGRLQELDTQIAAAETNIGRIDQRERGLERIKELEAEERRLAGEFEELERQLYLTEQFIRTKVSLLEEKINSRFTLARFKLFDQQVNGGLAEACETTYQGVPYSDLNHGSKVNVGLDIINTLAEHYGFVAPVIVDNAESVTAILPTRGQQIRLVVSAADKSLRVEKEPAKIMEVA